MQTDFLRILWKKEKVKQNSNACKIANSKTSGKEITIFQITWGQNKAIEENTNNLDKKIFISSPVKMHINPQES